MKGLIAAGAVLGLSLGGAPLGAQEAPPEAMGWFSANVSVASDYAFRGISQTLGEAAIQGGMDLAHPLGLYLGAWGSSVNFGEDLASGARAQMELDVYGGVAGAPLGLVELDLGFVYYTYPGAAGGRGYDFLELGLDAGRDLGPVSTAASLRYSPDFFAGSGTGLYYGGALGVPVSRLTLSGSVGRQTVEENGTFGTPDYVEWGLGAAVDAAGFQLGGRYLSTDLSAADCFGGSDLCGARFVLSLSRAL